MAAAQSLKLSDSGRTYLESVTHARTMKAQTVSRAGTLPLKHTENLLTLLLSSLT